MAVQYIDQMVIRFSIAKPSKIYPNWDFWFENKPSGNPDFDTETESKSTYGV
jgi:hypothetical protein